MARVLIMIPAYNERENIERTIQDTLLWLLSGIIMLVLAVFPQILGGIATLVGIYAPTNALFAFMFFCVIMILMSLTAIVSRLNEKNKRVIQSLALMEKRVRNLEEEKDKVPE